MPKAASLIAALVAILICAQGLNRAQALELAQGGSRPPARLPGSVIPSRYEVSVEPRLAEATFAGQEAIAVSITKPVKEVVLNAKDMSVSSASIARAGSGARHWLPLSIRLDDKTEQLRLTPKSALSPGRYDLNIEFKGVLNDKLCGFYKAYYNDDKGGRHYIAATQMEPTDARRMFPSFDEPEYKANFKLTAVIDEGDTAISNAPVLSRTTDAKTHKVKVVFADTPKMSTYLVALIVGKFEASKERVVEGVPVRVYFVPGKEGMSDYAQDFAARLLPWYHNYFGIRYPGKKLDLIAIPDFEAGAMENLGAITFRETLLLIDPKTASLEAKQHCAGVVAHEIAHMWFGDLVTMQWWDDLWLNEAFATWMATRAVDKLMPQWKAWDDFALGRAWALTTDSLVSTRPIHFHVDNPAQANEMFDEITYTKGASVLRMLEEYVGESRFQLGVHNYLEKHAWGNARTEDLWSAIGEAARLPVPHLMKGWVHQSGYPLVSVGQGKDKASLAVFQRRFLLDPLAHGESEIWQVPLSLRRLNYKDDASAKTVQVVTKRENVIAVNPSDKPLLANAGANGYFRVHYQPAMLEAIRPWICRSLTPAERVGLVSDNWAQTLAGLLPVTDHLRLTEAFKDDLDPSSAGVLISQFDHLDGFISPATRPYFAAFVRDRLEKMRARLGWVAQPGESDRMKLLRDRVLTALGTVGESEETIAQARKLFRDYLRSPESVDANLVGPITTIVAYNGDGDDYEKIRQCWLEARTPEVEERNLLCLALFQKPELVRRTLDLCLSDEVRVQDAPHLLSTLMGNETAKASTWTFIKSNWGTILKRYPMNMVPRVVGSLGSLNTAEQESQLRDFFKSHPVPAGQRAVARMLERVRIGVAFRRKSVVPLESYLAASQKRGH